MDHSYDSMRKSILVDILNSLSFSDNTLKLLLVDALQKLHNNRDEEVIQYLINHKVQLDDMK